MNAPIRIVGLTVMLAIILGAILFYARPDTEYPQDISADKRQNILSVDKTIHDFGAISMKDGKVRTVFKIKNTEPVAVALRKMYTSCMCTEATLIIKDAREGPFGMPGHGIAPAFNRELKPDEEAGIEVEFDPNAHGPAGVGQIERLVILEGPDGELVAVTIKANVTP